MTAFSRTDAGRLAGERAERYVSAYGRQLAAAVSAAIGAGELLLEAFNSLGGAPGGRGKCEADTQAEKLIHGILDTRFPDYGFRGEEIPALNRFSAADPEASLRWLVDPNDGTDAYLSGRRGAAVSIGLVHGDVPVLGVVFAYAARCGRGDIFFWAQGGPLVRGGEDVSNSSRVRVSGLPLVITSGGSDTASRAFSAVCAPYRFRAEPSIAYRFALVAAGEADAAFSLHNPSDYDVAAGHALLLGAGGDLYAEGGAPIRYGQSAGPDGQWMHVGNCWGGVGQVPLELASRDWTLAKKTQNVRHPEYPFVKSEKHLVFSDDPEILSRACGCLLGAVAGDSLGSLVEFKSSREISLLHPVPEDFNLTDGGVWGTLSGQPTDDTELALMLARSILRAGKYDADEAALAYAFWHDSHPFDEGGTTRAALAGISRRAADVSPSSAALRGAATRSESEANGALMRLAPLPVYAMFQPRENIVAWAMQDASLTHANPVCALSNAAFAVAIVSLLRGDAGETAWRNAIDAVRDLGLRNLSKYSVTVVSALEAAAQGFPRDYESHMGHVLLCLHNAFSCLLSGLGLVEGIRKSALAGGDTDTNAAVAGALLGAACGENELPSAWKAAILSCRPIEGTCLRPRPEPLWPVDIPRIAERLLVLGRQSVIS